MNAATRMISTSPHASKVLREWDRQIHSGTLSDKEKELMEADYTFLVTSMKSKGYLQCTRIQSMGRGRRCVNIISKKLSVRCRKHPSTQWEIPWCHRCCQEFDHLNKKFQGNALSINPTSYYTKINIGAASE